MRHFTNSGHRMCDVPPAIIERAIADAIRNVRHALPERFDWWLAYAIGLASR